MGMVARAPVLPYADFLTLEKSSEAKHEWHEEEGVFDMSGGTPEHSAIAAAIIAELHAALRGRPCRVHDSNMAVKIEEPEKRLVCPDASVVCGRFEADPENPRGLRDLMDRSFSDIDHERPSTSKLVAQRSRVPMKNTAAMVSVFAFSLVSLAACTESSSSSGAPPTPTPPEGGTASPPTCASWRTSPWRRVRESR